MLVEKWSDVKSWSGCLTRCRDEGTPAGEGMECMEGEMEGLSDKHIRSNNRCDPC